MTHRDALLICFTKIIVQLYSRSELSMSRDNLTLVCTVFEAGEVEVTLSHFVARVVMFSPWAAPRF